MPTSDALPVVLALGGPAAGRIRRHLEGELGWQPVEPDGPVPAAVRIVDVPGSREAPVGGPPSWLVVTEHDAPHEAARAAADLDAESVIAWPPTDGAFVAAAAALPPATPVGDQPELRVGGASGGVGCTTVALALAGLEAWNGRATLVVTHGVVPHPVGPTLDPETLRSPDVARAGRSVRGVNGLDVVHVSGPAPELTVRVEGRTVVRDLGTADPGVDVLVVRRDAAGLQAAHETVAGTVLVSDAGIVPQRSFHDAVGGRRLVLLPWSARVARAAVLGRVPASLPGSWLRTLATVTGRRPQPHRSVARQRGGASLR